MQHSPVEESKLLTYIPQPDLFFRSGLLCSFWSLHWRRFSGHVLSQYQDGSLHRYLADRWLVASLSNNATRMFESVAGHYNRRQRSQGTAPLAPKGQEGFVGNVFPWNDDLDAAAYANSRPCMRSCSPRENGAWSMCNFCVRKVGVFHCLTSASAYLKW